MRLTPLRAIRKYCIECHGHQRDMVEGCPDHECHLYPYRMGHNPNRKGIGRKGGNPDIENVQKKSLPNIGTHTVIHRIDFKAKP